MRAIGRPASSPSPTSDRRRSAPVQATETLGKSTITVSLPSLAAGATHTATYRLPTERRGCYTVGPLHIGRSDPLRLISASQADSAEASLWVLPRIHRASPIPTGRSQELEGPTSNSAPRGGIAFHSLREYVAGDDPAPDPLEVHGPDGHPHGPPHRHYKRARGC